VARWVVRAAARPEPYPLAAVLRDKTYRHELLAGGPAYAEAWKDFEGGEVNLSLEMPQATLFGLRAGSSPWLPPWLAGYLAIVIPGAVVIKRVLRVH
jgi:hypothetical protein